MTLIAEDKGIKELTCFSLLPLAIDNESWFNHCNYASLIKKVKSQLKLVLWQQHLYQHFYCHLQFVLYLMYFLLDPKTFVKSKCWYSSWPIKHSWSKNLNKTHHFFKASISAEMRKKVENVINCLHPVELKVGLLFSVLFMNEHLHQAGNTANPPQRNWKFHALECFWRKCGLKQFKWQSLIIILGTNEPC